MRFLPSRLFAVSLVILLGFWTTSNTINGLAEASIMDMLNIKNNLLEKFTPFLTKFPKALPLLNGKVKSAECRKQGHRIADKAAEFTKQFQSSEEVDPSEIFKLYCTMRKECFFEYMEALKPLLETQAAKQILDGVDISDASLVAGPVYDWMCSEKERDEL